MESQRLLILGACAPEAEYTADDDRPVTARWGELVERLEEERRLEAFAAGALPAEGEHVGRHVTAVDVEACAKQGNSSLPVPQPTSSAGCPRSTNRWKYSISCPSVTNSAHHSATSP